jgi:hypothetical protein
VLRTCTLSPHLVSTPCPHTLSLYASSPHLVPTPCLFTLRRRTLSLRFVESESASDRSAKGQAYRPRPRPRAPVLPVLPCLPVLPTGIDRYRQVSTGGDRIDDHRRMVLQCGADIPVCAGRRGQAGMPAPHCHAPSLRPAGTALPCGLARFCGNFPCTRPPSTTADPHRPQSTPVDDNRGW